MIFLVKIIRTCQIAISMVMITMASRVIYRMSMLAMARRRTNRISNSNINNNSSLQISLEMQQDLLVMISVVMIALMLGISKETICQEVQQEKQVWDKSNSFIVLRTSLNRIQISTYLTKTLV
jgi:hypothetical protein